MDTDILEELSITDKKLTTNTTTDTPKSKNTVDNYTNVNIKPLPITAADVTNKTKSFTIYTYPKDGLPNEATMKIYQAAIKLVNKGYIFRHTGSKDDSLQNLILSIDGIVVESYLPFKKFNPNITSPILPNTRAYRVNAYLSKYFTKQPDFVRAINTSQIQAVLGKDISDKTSVILAWTACGSETFKKKIDYKIGGSISNYINMMYKFNVPLINMKSEDADERLDAIIESNENKPTNNSSAESDVDI